MFQELRHLRAYDSWDSVKHQCCFGKCQGPHGLDPGAEGTRKDRFITGVNIQGVSLKMLFSKNSVKIERIEIKL